jgi:hypothetical protein
MPILNINTDSANNCVETRKSTALLGTMCDSGGKTIGVNFTRKTFCGPEMGCE